MSKTRILFKLAAGLFFSALLLLPASAKNIRLTPIAQPATAPAQTESQPSGGPQAGLQQPPTANFNAAAKQQTTQYLLAPDRYQKAVTYSRKLYIIYFVSFGVIIGGLLLILQSGVAAKFRDFAEHWTGNRILQALVFVTCLLGALALLDLPLRLYSHALSLHYQQSVQPWSSWFADWCKSEALSIGFILVFVLLLFALVRWRSRNWWLYFWIASLPILLFFLFIAPWLVDPLFNQFESLMAKDPALVSALEQVIHRTNLKIPPGRMFLMDASQKTNEVNAYVTGLGASKRVVVWDTTLQKLTAQETLYVFSHELGHYVLNHVRNGFLFFAALLLAALSIAHHALHGLLDRWGATWKIYGLEDWASFAVILLLFYVMMFFAAPLTNAFSRMQEHDADIYGLEIIHGVVPDSQQIAAQSFQKLGEIDLADPDPPPFIKFWLYTHPPLAERLSFVRDYDPWSAGESPKYVK